MWKVVSVGITFLAALALLSGLSTIYINPNTFWLPAFIGLAFPFFVVFNFVLIFLWRIFGKDKRKKWAFVPLIAMVALMPYLGRVYNLSINNNPDDALKVMTWNVRNFDLYHWSHNEDTRDRMLEFIEEEDPDVICFQEFYTEKNGEFDNVAALKALGYQHFHYGQSLILQNKYQWGLMTFSKYPITYKEVIEFDESKHNLCTVSDIQLEDTTIRLYNVHFQSIQFGADDYEFIEDMSVNPSSNYLPTRTIIRKMKVAYEKRAKQAHKVKASMDAHSGLKMICGDFNDTPMSYTYQTISKGMKDAFIKEGGGFGQTYNIVPIPSLRIDYVFADNGIEIHSYNRVKKKYSDHYPIVVKVSVD